MAPMWLAAANPDASGSKWWTKANADAKQELGISPSTEDSQEEFLSKLVKAKKSDGRASRGSKAKAGAARQAWSPADWQSGQKKNMFQLGKGANSTPSLPSPFPTLLTPANDMYYEQHEGLGAQKNVLDQGGIQKNRPAKAGKAKQKAALRSLGNDRPMILQSNGHSPGKMRSAALLARGVDWISSTKEKVFQNNRVTTLTQKLQASPLLTGRLDREQVSELRSSLNLPEEIMSEAHDLFRRHANPAANGRGLLKNRRLTEAGFANAWAEMTGQGDEDADDISAVPAQVLAEAFRHAGSSQELDFDQFALWFSSRCFCEDVSLDKESKELRRIARKHSMHHAEVESYKQMFKRFDKDGNGAIDSGEFAELLQTCVKVPSNIGLPASRIENLWRIADRNGDQVLDFEEFLTFHAKYLRADSTGFEDIYRYGLSRQA